MSNQIKDRVESVEYLSLVLEVLNKIKTKHENIDYSLAELRKDLNKLHSKVDSIDEVRKELIQLENKVLNSIDLSKKELIKKIDSLTKYNKDITERFVIWTEQNEKQTDKTNKDQLKIKDDVLIKNEEKELK
jgi:hypothetical protein